MLSVREAAEYLGKTPSTFYKHWKGWGVPGYQVGRTLKFRQSELDTWLRSQRVTG